MVKAILFDLGDTLIKNINIDLEVGLIKLFPTLKDNQEFHQYFLSFIDILKNRQDIEYNINDLFDELFQKFDLHSSNSKEELERKLFQYSCVDEAMDGVYSVLDYLKQKKMIMGVVSNSLFHQKILADKLDSFNLLNYFSFVLSSQDVGFRKGSSLIFEKAYQELLNIDSTINKCDVIFIGDNYKLDYESSMNYGFNAIWFHNMKDLLNDIKEIV